MDAPPIARFAAFEFNPATLELRREGRRVRLAPQPARVLAVLLQQHGELVTREALKLTIWAQDTFVEFDQGLTYCIKQLRGALRDDARSPEFIETIPKRGYRFIAPVSFDQPPELPAAPEGPAVVEEGEPAALGAPRATSWISRPLWIAAAIVVLVGVAWFGASRLRSDAASVRIESLVVLPIGNLSGGTEPDYLADSMTDALITSLGQISGLRVISRTSAVTYKGAGKTVPQIARELNVDAVVEGTVERSGERVRWNLKLIEASTDRTRWAQSYERDLENALALHNEIARTIASRTAVTLTPSETARLAATTQVNPKVYEAYLKGRYFWNRRSEPDMQQAIAHFEEALRHNPRYAPAYAGLADSYALYGSYGWTLAGGKPWARALTAAEKALAIDEYLADAHTSRARIALNYELDWAGAGRGYQRALELNPGYANARHWYGYYLLLSGRFEEGERELRRALELDPLSPIINANIGMRFYMARQFDEAIAHWRNALEMHRNYRLLHDYVTTAYIGKAMYPEALAELQKSIVLSGTGPWEIAMLAHIYGRMGRDKEAREQLSQLLSRGDAPGYFIALAYAGLGEKDAAFTWLDKTIDERWGPFNELNAEPMFDPLRTDPRFADAVRRMYGK